MDTLENPFQMCIALGQALAQTEEYKRFKEAEYQLLHNAEARTLLENLQMMQIEEQKKKLLGQELTAEEKKNLEALEKASLENPLIKNSHYTNMQFQNLMKAITAKIKEGISSVDKAPDEQ